MSWRSTARRTVARVFGTMSSSSPHGLRVLTYHRVNDRHPNDRLTVRPAAFREQLAALERSGRPVVDLESSLPALRGEAPLPEGAVAITFDDGYRDNHDAALPLLGEHGFTATFFLATSLIGSPGRIDRYASCCDADAMMSWEEAADLRAAGHRLGGHGRTHRELTALAAHELREEARGCAEDIANRLGTRPRLFCYPRGKVDASVRGAVGEAGFEAAFTVKPGPNPPGADLLTLTRTEVAGGDTLDDFLLKLDGGFDAWHRFAQRGHAAR